MRHRDLGSKEFQLDVGYSQSALSKDIRVSIGQLLLDFRPSFPPPADDVDDIAVIREQAGVSLGVMLVPSLLLPLLHVPDFCLVLTVVIAKGRPRPNCHQAQNQRF